MLGMAKSVSFQVQGQTQYRWADRQRRSLKRKKESEANWWIGSLREGKRCMVSEEIKVKDVSQTTYTTTDHILVWIRAYLCVLFFLFPPGCARFKDNNKSFKAVCFLSLKANVKFLLPEIDGGFCFFLIKWHKFNCKPSQLTLITLWKIWYMWCVLALFSFIKCSGHSPARVSVHANAVSTVHCFKPGVQWST